MIARPSPYAACASSGRLHVLDEADDGLPEPVGLTGQFVGILQRNAGMLVGFCRGLQHACDVARDLVGALRGPLDIARDLAGRGALFLDGARGGCRDLVDFQNDGFDALDGGRSLFGLALD